MVEICKECGCPYEELDGVKYPHAIQWFDAGHSLPPRKGVYIVTLRSNIVMPMYISEETDMSRIKAWAFMPEPYMPEIVEESGDIEETENGV